MNEKLTLCLKNFIVLCFSLFFSLLTVQCILTVALDKEYFENSVFWGSKAKLLTVKSLIVSEEVCV